MDLVIRTGFAPIFFTDNFDPQKIKKGKALSANHVKRVEELRGMCDSRLIRASVIKTTNITEHPYKVELELSEKRMVTNSSCTCISGISKKCKHIYAVIHYINTYRSLSKTAFEQEWGKPSDAQLGKDMYAQPLVITDVYKIATNYNRHAKPVEVFDLTYSDVEDINCPLRIVLQVQDINHIVLFVQDIIQEMLDVVIVCYDMEQREVCSEILNNLSVNSICYYGDISFLNAECKDFYEENIRLNEKEIIELCYDTKDQNSCEEWYRVRYLRISASSKAHSIKTRSKKTVESLVSDFMNTDQKKKIASLEYGIKHEKDAINDNIVQYGAVVKLIDVYVMPFEPWLCVSPDGLIIQDDCVIKILEVKCPSSCKSKPVFEESSGKFNVPYLYLYKGDVTLKASHQYYTQCQISMYATGVTECDLYVWSPKGSCLANVHRDEVFLQETIPYLEYFYFYHFLPALCKKNNKMEG